MLTSLAYVGLLWLLALTYWPQKLVVSSLPPQTTCANAHELWFICFQTWLFASLVTSEPLDRSRTLCLLAVETGTGIKYQYG